MTSLLQYCGGLRNQSTCSQGKEAKHSGTGQFLLTPPCGHLFPQEIPRKGSTLSSPFPFPEKHHLPCPCPLIHSLPGQLLFPTSSSECFLSPFLPAPVTNTCPGAYHFLNHPPSGGDFQSHLLTHHMP